MMCVCVCVGSVRAPQAMGALVRQPGQGPPRAAGRQECRLEVRARPRGPYFTGRAITSGRAGCGPEHNEADRRSAGGHTRAYPWIPTRSDGTDGTTVGVPCGGRPESRRPLTPQKATTWFTKRFCLSAAPHQWCPLFLAAPCCGCAGVRAGIG